MSQRSSLPVLILAVLAGFAGGLFSQQLTRPAQAASGNVVTAQGFRLVDASGKLLAQLGTVKLPNKKTETQFVLYSPHGYQTSLGDGGLYFGKGYGNENIGIGYAYGKSGKLSPCIFFWFNRRGRMGMMLDADKAGAPSAWMYDTKGATLWAAPSPTPSP